MVTPSRSHHMVLFIDSDRPRSVRAAERLEALCRRHLAEDYTLALIDLRTHAERFESQRVVAVPTLDITFSSGKTQRFVGDFSCPEQIIVALGMARQAKQMAVKALEMKEQLTGSAREPEEP
jgi:hypothetical protein